MGLLASYGFATPVFFRPPPVGKCASAGLHWLIKYGGPQFGLDYTAINPAVLDICSGSRCPLGQASRNGFGYALDLMGVSFVPRRGQRFSNVWLVQHGFLSGGEERIRPLNEAWRDLLAKDLAAWASQPEGVAA